MTFVAQAANSGANLALSPRTPAAFSKAGMLSPAGRCRTLDSAADGYARAEAVAMMLLQVSGAAFLGHVRDGPSATADGAEALMVICGSAVNQDGRSSALTAPSGPAQQAVLQAALTAAGTPGSNIAALQVVRCVPICLHSLTEFRLPLA